MIITIIILLALTYLCYACFLVKPKGKVEGLSDRYVLITGCDSGFGRLLAESLCQQKVNVFAGCLTLDAVQELNEKYSTIHAFILDITRAEQVEQAYELVHKTLPKDVGLWGIVNNAGILINGFTDWLSTEDYHRIVDINLYGTIRMSNQFVPLIKIAKGRVVNVASILGIACPFYFAPYCVSKAGVIAFSNVLRREMAPFDVSVSCMCPGLFRTPLSQPAKILEELKEKQSKLSQQLQKTYNQKFFTSLEESLLAIAGKASPEVNKVTEAIENALFSIAPREFYYIGSDTWIFLIISYLPYSLADWLLRKFLPMPNPNTSEL
ncbi:17-beta-hydroxysteroid dehydrogenase type 6 [Trichoplax sp. H2]|nr:17-beta-hydroxysteroid dehydrogenase type 6 [Trichoplax sp. H2]|eukprot:RDD45816.1 17-beta-hydroxysteroid dehydrogenase type 6 [Trichoplax sp. H2]